MKNEINRKVLLDNISKTKEDLFKNVSLWALENSIIKDEQRSYQELIDREKAGDIIINPKTSLPHVKSNNILFSSIIFVVTDNLIWNDTENSISYNLFLLIKANENDVNLEIIRAVVRKFADDSFINQLNLNSNNEKSIYNIIFD